MTRVLVVDDSRFMRTVIGDALEEAGYHVHRATDGENALDAVAKFEPDVVTMDVEMPGIDGIDAVDRIMADRPTPIVMLSAHTEAGADATMEAMERGAMAVIAKTSDDPSRTLSDLTDDIVDTVAELAAASTSALALAQTTAAATRSQARLQSVSLQPSGTGGGATVARPSVSTRSRESAASTPDSLGRSAGLASPRSEATLAVENSPEVEPTVIVGASTGGPRIVEHLLVSVPRSLKARFVVVQHMPDGFTERFARRLDTVSEYSVREASEFDHVTAGEAVVAPGESHLKVTAADGDGVAVEHSPGSRIHGVRPAIDVTMTSAASTRVDGLFGVALSGIGRDGAHGIESIHEVGGRTFAQDEVTSPVYGIPKRAIETGAVDHVVSAGSLPSRLVEAAVSTDQRVCTGENNG